MSKETPRELHKLSDFKPLKRVSLPGLGDLACSGLVVLVGPNSSGKSQLLQDIYRRLAGEPRQLVVASDVQIEKPPYEPFMRCLEEEGYFSTLEDDAGNKHLQPQTMFLGTGQAIGQIQPKQAQNWYSAYAPDTHQPARRPSEFLAYFGRLLVTALFLDRRLTSLTSVGVIDFQTQSPQHDLHALYLDDKARARLHSELIDSFGRTAWPDMSRGNTMSLKVSDEGVMPSADDLLSYKKMAEFRSIESEGDGLKSYLATCVSLLLGNRPVCLIDEPEMCLHPPQAYNLGKFIGQYGTGAEGVTFVATHSSHLLRGILQTAQKVQIVRLTRREKTFSAHLVPSGELSDALTRPTLRAESVLDGIFAQAVAVVEADGDRVVYQAVWETLRSAFRLDLHFSTVGGTGGIADTCGLYRTLKIPIAVVSDLDVLTDSEKMQRILSKLVDDQATRDVLLIACAEISEAVRQQPPTISAEEVAAELSVIASLGMDWSQNDDVELKKRLSRLTKDIDRSLRLKRGGVSSYTGTLADQMSAVLSDLRKVGLFLVPVGELEEWLADKNVGISKSNKRAWSNAAAQKIDSLGKQQGDVWDFVAEIGRYISKSPKHEKTSGA